MKRRGQARKDIVANYISDKGVIVRIWIYKELSKPNKCENNPVKFTQWFEQVLHQKWYTDGREAQEKVLSIITC